MSKIVRHLQYLSVLYSNDTEQYEAKSHACVMLNDFIMKRCQNKQRKMISIMMLNDDNSQGNNDCDI